MLTMSQVCDRLYEIHVEMTNRIIPQSGFLTGGKHPAAMVEELCREVAAQEKIAPMSTRRKSATTDTVEANLDREIGINAELLSQVNDLTVQLTTERARCQSLGRECAALREAPAVNAIDFLSRMVDSLPVGSSVSLMMSTIATP